MNIDPGLEEEVRITYPSLAYLLDTNPEVAAVLEQAINGDGIRPWSLDRLFNAIYDTAWWKATEPSIRQAEHLRHVDPAGYQSLLDDKMNEAARLLDARGLNLSPNSIYVAAENSIQQGWDDDRFLYELIDQSRVSGNRPDNLSDYNANLEALRQSHKAYFMPYDEETLNGWAWDIMNGDLSLSQVEAQVQQQAKANYSWLAPLIDQGFTLYEGTQTLRSAIADTLELSPTDIDFTQPEWNDYIAYSPEGQDVRTMSLTEARAKARKDPRYRYTDRANDKAERFRHIILSEFGALG